MFELRRARFRKWTLVSLAWPYLPRKLKRIAIGAAAVVFLSATLVVAALIILITYLA